MNRTTAWRLGFPGGVMAVGLVLAWAAAAADPAAGLRIATFRCDVTPPVGQPLFSGDPLEKVEAPLLAKGVVLESGGKRHVLCAIDWCMISNGSHAALRRRIAEAVGAGADDVAVQTLHQHTAPMVDLEAQRVLAQHGDATAHLDPDWCAAVERRIATAAAEAVARLERCDRVGVGQGRVDRVASSRRVPDGRGGVVVRMSRPEAALRDLPEGTIDPYVKTVTFAAGEKPLVRLHYYATHPQVKYGNGVATSDFVGLAREKLEADEGVFQVYFTGCGGDITVGKYNDGSDASRLALAERLRAGIDAAIAATVFEPVQAVRWHVRPVVLPRRDDPDFTAAACVERLRDPKASPVMKLYRSAMRLVSLQRAAEPVVLSCLEAGPARIVHLPGEPFLDFQMHAQRLLPGGFVAVAGYGDNATGYLPTAAEFPVGGYEPSVAVCKPEAEAIVKRAVAELLGAGPPAPRAAGGPAVERLPRIPPREPAAALASFQVAEGYRIEPVATEPLIHSPVAVDYDADGRLYVVEMIDYSEQGDDRLGVIRLLDDTDGDGRYDAARPFATGLSWPTGVLCFDGGVFVCAAPDILYLKDTDGDGTADVRRVVFTGFGRSNVQGLLNSLRWGLDSRVHGATSSAGATAVSRPDDPQFAPLNLTGRDFSFDPRRLDLRPESGCLQHGMSFDDWGRKFVSGNSQPLEMVLFEDRYAARNPFRVMPPARRSIAVEGGADEVFRSSPVEPWRVVRTKMRVANPALGVVEGGGRAAGYFTGATGVTAVRGDAYPAAMRECLVVGDVGGNLVHRERLAPAGPFLEARRIDRGSEFVRSDDNWFRPAQFANAPDGTLHVLDVYREVIEHPLALPPEIKSQLDLTSGQDRGRIYRIVPAGFTPRPRPALGRAPTAELVALLAHRNGWHRDTAARLLYERQDPQAVPALERLAREASLPEGRMHALYALAGLGRLSPATLLGALGDAHPRVREHAVRLGERQPEVAVLRERLCGMTGDQDARVRYQLAFSLGELPCDAARNAALARLAKRDAADASFRAAIGSSLVKGADEVLATLATDTDFDADSAAGSLLEELSAQVGQQLDAEPVARVEALLARLPADGRAADRVLAGYLAGRSKAAAERLRERPLSAAVAAARERLLDRTRAVAVDDGRPEAERVRAIGLLFAGSFADSAAVFETLLESRQPQPVQAAALEAINAIGDAAGGRWLLARWPRMSPRMRSLAANLLLGREPWVLAVFDAIEAGTFAITDLDQAQLRLLSKRREPAIQARYKAIASRVRASPRDEVIAAYRPALDLAGDVGRGRGHFTRVCSQCHKVGDLGHALGPSLAAFKSRGREAVMLNVLDPNREVNPLYVNYIAQLADGRSLTGMIADETATSVTLRRGENASDTVSRADLEELVSTGQSIMPEGLEKQLDHQAMADLLAFLDALP
jgi:putative membrane-bound dehydrogenase-like protein